MGLRPGDKVMIYADTCAEWLITALACFKSSLTIVTIYTNLGRAGVSFSINQVITYEMSQLNIALKNVS